MKSLPTDLEILEIIYEDYYQTFISYSKDSPDRSSKTYVPIDIEKLSSEFDIDGDIIFGRLYYHLDKKHGYKNDDDTLVHLFARIAGNDRHCINFPLMSSILADLQTENKKFKVATMTAAFSLLVSIVSLLISFLA